MSEANKPTEYVMTCIDGTTFRLPVDVPVWDQGSNQMRIGEYWVDEIYRDPSLMPEEFLKYKQVREVSEVEEVDEVPPGESEFISLEIHASSQLLPPMHTMVMGRDGNIWDIVERYGSENDWSWQNQEGFFRSKNAISHWFYFPKLSEVKVREVSEVKEADEVPIRDIFSEIDELKADVEWLKKEVRRVDWKDAYD